MLKVYSSILPIAFSSAMVSMSNGFLASFLPNRINVNDIDPARTSDFVAVFALGMLVSCLLSANLIKRVGHIRAFCVIACLSGLATLMLPVFEAYAPWLVFRFIHGFCGNAIFLVAQSWLNDQTESKYRGQILTTYYIIYVLGIGTGAFLVSKFEPTSLYPFMLGSGLILTSILPVGLTRLPAPPPPELTQIRVKKLWKTSPVGMFGCFVGGATAMTMQGMGPVIGVEINLSYAQIGTMMALAQLGSIMQFPLGYISDKIDRRFVLLFCGAGLLIGGVMIGELSADYFWLTVLTVAIFVGIGETTYTISLALANDRAEAGEYSSIAGTSSLIWCLGSILGPMIGSLTIGSLGASGVSYFCTAIASVFVGFTVLRIREREAPTEEEQHEFYVAPSVIATSEVYLDEEVVQAEMDASSKD